MKTTKTVKVPAKVIKATTRTVEKTVCDITNCKNDASPKPYGGGGSTCTVCRRDLCATHRLRDFPDGGDYSTDYCDPCYTLYMPELELLHEKHYEEEQALRRKIKQIVLKQG